MLPENVRYSDIKMTIAILMVKTGFVRPTKSSMEGLISPPAHSSTSTVSTIRVLDRLCISATIPLVSFPGWYMSLGMRQLSKSWLLQYICRYGKLGGLGVLMVLYMYHAN